MTGGRDCALYRMRLKDLRKLAVCIEDAGYPAVVVEPPGMPVLRIRRPGVSDLDIVAGIGHDWRDWYHYRHSGAEIAPAADMAGIEDAAQVILTGLRHPASAPPRVEAGS